MTTMKNKTLTLIALSIFTFALLAGFASAATISQWNLTTDGAATNKNANLVAGTFSSSGVTFSSFDDTDGAGSTNWPGPTTTSKDATKYYEVTISPATGYFITLTDIDFDYNASSAGPASFVLQYSKSASFASPTSVVTKTDVTTGAQKNSLTSGLNVSVYTGETLTLRWFGYDFDATSNKFSVNDLILSGTLTRSPTEIQTCSATGNPGVLDVKKIDFDNTGHSYSSFSSFSSSFGKDDEWYPLDDIEVQIEIENDGDYDIDDVEIAWGLYNTDANEWVIDMDEESDFNLKDGKEETKIVSFVIDDDMDIDLEDLEDGEHYRLYVTATGTIDDNDSPNDGNETCVSDFETASIIIENDFVVLDNIEMPEVVSCGDTVTVTANVWNIGNSDQDEVTVRVSDRGNLLGVAETIEVGDIDLFDKQGISFSFDVPRSLDEESNALIFKVIDEDGDVYESEGDDESKFTVLLEVTNCGSSINDITVSASLVSEAKAGQPLIVRTTITNTMSSSGTFSVGAAGFGSWASSVQIDQPTVLLDAGQSKDVLLTLDVIKDAKGAQTFFVEIVSGEGQVTRQPVQVNIEAKSLFGFTGNSVLGGGNATLWIIGLLNIILVVVIIIVAVRVARR